MPWTQYEIFKIMITHGVFRSPAIQCLVFYAYLCVITGLSDNPLSSRGLHCLGVCLVSCSSCILIYWIKNIAFGHDGVIKWKHFSRYWPFVMGIHRSPVVPPQRPMTQSFDILFDLRLNKQTTRRRWFEMPSCSVWRHCNVSWQPCIHSRARRRLHRSTMMLHVQHCNDWGRS